MVTTISLHVFVLHQPLSIRSYNSSTEKCCLPRKQHIWPTNASLKLHHNLPQSRKNQQTHRIKKNYSNDQSLFTHIKKRYTFVFFIARSGVADGWLEGGPVVFRVYSIGFCVLSKNPLFDNCWATSDLGLDRRNDDIRSSKVPLKFTTKQSAHHTQQTHFTHNNLLAILINTHSQHTTLCTLTISKE